MHSRLAGVPTSASGEWQSNQLRVGVASWFVDHDGRFRGSIGTLPELPEDVFVSGDGMRLCILTDPTIGLADGDYVRFVEGRNGDVDLRKLCFLRLHLKNANFVSFVIKL